MKGLSSEEQGRIENPKTILDNPGSSLKVRRSVAVLGLALSVGTTGVLIDQQNSRDLHVIPIVQSPQTFANVLSEHQGNKFELSHALIGSSTWGNNKGVLVHEVREDETLFQLTQQYRIDAAAIATSNGISAATPLQPGTKLLIPPVTGIIYKVKSGDTLEAISKFYNVPKSAIVKYTSLSSSELIAVNQPIVIPGNVSTLIKVREDDAKQRLSAKRDFLRQRLESVEGKKVLVSSSTSNKLKKQPKFVQYTVKKGDTVETIARRYGTSQRLIAQHNKIHDLNWLFVGRELKIPATKDASSSQTVAYNRQKPQKLAFAVPSRLERQPTALSKSKVNKPASDKLETVKSVPGKTEVLAIKVNAATPILLPSATLNPKAAVPATQTSARNLQLQATLPSAWDGFVQLPKLAVAPTIQSLDIPEQSTTKSKPLANSTNSLVAQPAAESSLDMSKKIAVAPSIQSFDVVEQTLAKQKPSESTQIQPNSEPSIKLPKFAVAPSTPAVGIIEQSILPGSVPVESSTIQPVVEPSIKLPKFDVVQTISLASSRAIEQQNAGKGNPTEIALLPESEARMTSLEVRRLELEVEQLNDKVKQAEIESAARKAEAARQAEATRRVEELRRTEASKIAAANIRPFNTSERSFDNGREAIANTGKASPLAPNLPELVAKAYLPDSGYGVPTGMVWPAEGTLTSGFGWRWGRVHQGIDIAAPTGTPILAAATGTVDFAGWNDGGYGNMVDIRHDDGTITRYGHLSAVYVKTGQPVNQAQVIAAMGSTGFSTGPHLHFEIRPGGGRAVDPMSFFASAKR